MLRSCRQLSHGVSKELRVIRNANSLLLLECDGLGDYGVCRK